MKPLPRAVNAPELLDESAHDPHELAESLADIAAVNRWLGGARSLLRHLVPLLRTDRATRILDVGTGSADLPLRIVAWARKHGRRVAITATDLHPQMCALAAERCADYPEITLEAADALALPYAPAAFDVALLTLTLHHFDEPEQIRALRELNRVAARAAIVNELQRTRLNYLGAQLLARTLWRGNRLTRHDGPLSVLRAFTPGELRRLCAHAGLTGHVHEHFFQRVVLVIDSASRAAAHTDWK